MLEAVTDEAAGTRVVHDLGPVSRIPLGEGRTFALAGVSVAVFRARSGAVFATQSSCPHRAGPLADGLIGAGTVVCPLHAYRFDLVTGRALGNECAALTTYDVSVSAAGELRLALPARA